MREAIYEMSKKGLGITAVVDDGGAPGGLHLGRRPAPPARARRASSCTAPPASACSPSPRTIAGDELASAALSTMEDHRITSLFVCDRRRRGSLGIVHLHDLWGLELF